MESFKRECLEWLVPLGYRLYASNESEGVFIFEHETDYKPLITCKLSEGVKYAKLEDVTSFSYHLKLTSGNLNIGDPKISGYLDLFNSYSKLKKLDNKSLNASSMELNDFVSYLKDELNKYILKVNLIYMSPEMRVSAEDLVIAMENAINWIEGK